MTAGYFTIFSTIALSFRWALVNDPGGAFIPAFLGTFVSIIFWLLDYRNYQLIVLAGGAGSAIERQIGDPKLGYFACYDEDKREHPNRFNRHQVVLSILYIGGGALMTFAGIMALALHWSIKIVKAS